MYKIFLDSIILKINYENYDEKVLFNEVVSYVKRLNYKITNVINQKIINKFNFMYLCRDEYGNNLLSSISFLNEQNTSATDVVFIYALKSGIYIEINGLVQYKKDHRVEKYRLMNKIWNKYRCYISRLDIAIDFDAKMNDINIFDREWEALSKNAKSTTNIHYFNVLNKQNRRLKLYYKSTQKYRSYPISRPLTRLELTLKGDFLKTAQTEDELTDRVKKEFSNYNILLLDEKIDIIYADIEAFTKNTFSLLQTGKQIKRYSNYTKNIDTSVQNMQIVWSTMNSPLSLKELAQVNNISLTTLKKYRRYYKFFSRF